MTILDLILLAGLSLAVLKGWRTGLLRNVISLAGIVLAYGLGLANGGAIAGWVAGGPVEPDSGAALAGFLAAFLLALIAFNIGGRILYRTLHASPFGLFDSLGGAAIGLANGLLILGLALLLLRAHPIHSRVPGAIDDSSLAGPIQRTALVLIDAIKATVPGARKLYEKLGVHSPNAAHPPLVDKISDKAGEAGARLDSLVKESRKRLESR